MPTMNVAIATKRLAVRKTYKLYIGGTFVRSESGRVLTARSRDGAELDNYSHASRKDFREAVVATGAAFDGRATVTAYLGGLMQYRAARMLEKRRDDLVMHLERC